MKSLLLESKYKFDRKEVSEEEWPEFSFWEGDQVKAEKHVRENGDQVKAEKHDEDENGDLVNTEENPRAEKVNQKVNGKQHIGTSPNSCWSKAVDSGGQSFALLKNTFWHCWLTGAV